MSAVFTIRLEDEDAATLVELAKKERRKPTQMLRVLFQEGIEARELAKESERVQEPVAV